MAKTKFSKEFLQDVLWEDVEGVEVVRNEIYDTSRWSIHYDLVFKFDGKFYQTYYSCGATESQDERPFEYESDPIEVTEVRPVEKTIIAYEPV